MDNIFRAAFDENLNEYTLDAVVVEADATKDQFGNTITEQSYYRTGGDVKVITREEIEKRHYQDLTDAIKRIPGVTFQNPGYRGGEYGYAPYNNSLSINGDSRVVVLVDGRRVDNATSTRFGSSNASGTRTMVDLNQVVNINNVEKIEVIKGPGASVYGADATGGVINIITRKGADENQGTIDLSTGSWKKHNYNVTYSGSAGDDKSWKYFISLDREMSGDTKYKDGLTGGNYTYRGTEFKEEGANIRIDKDFSDTENLRIWYNHRNGKDGYPITAPDYRFWNETEWNRIIQDTEDGKFGNTTNPGYRNLFVLDALSGSYNAFRNNDIDITYTFDKENGMESFIRFYDQDHHYWGVDRYPDWVADDGSFVPFPGSPAWDDFINNYQFSKTGPTTLYNEKNQGLQLQYGKSIDNNDLLFGLTYDKAKTYTKSLNRKDNTWKTTHVERDSILGFVQDKIHLSDKWDITPAIRYSNYSTFDKTNDAGTVSQGNTSSIIFTPTINTHFVGISAFIGAFTISLGVVFIANLGGKANSIKLLLAGMALSAVCSAFSSFIVYFANNKEGMQSIAFWLMGSLSGAKWDSIFIIAPIVMISILFFWTQSRILNLMLLGDEVAITLGRDLHIYRQVYLLVSSLIVGFVVYAAGMIGFVGLIIPHIIRMLVGTDHKKLVPISALAGAIFLVLADGLCRIIIPKTELPIGILISLIGAPCFVYLMIKKTYGFGGN